MKLVKMKLNCNPLVGFENVLFICQFEYIISVLHVNVDAEFFIDIQLDIK